jgi:hypothetical protein
MSSALVQARPLQDPDVLRLAPEVARDDSLRLLRVAPGAWLPVELHDAAKFLQPARLRLLDEEVRVELDAHGTQTNDPSGRFP